MEHGTTLLHGLEGVAVQRVELASDGTRVVHLVTADETAAACPSCGVFSSSVKQHVTTGPADLPYGIEGIELRWHKRRLRCAEPRCARGSFTETTGQIQWGARTTTRLRDACADAVADGRSISEVARSYRLSWPVVQRAVDAMAAAQLGEPEPVRTLGMDETRFGAPKWVFNAEICRWERTDPWQTGFVDLDGEQSVLGQASGRSSGTVCDWLNDRSQSWRDAITTVVIDPHAGYRKAIRDTLPDAVIVVDHFHFVALGNRMVTEVRQRVTRENRGRRSRKKDPEYANRRRLLTARQRLSDERLTQMRDELLDGDPSGQLLTAWKIKEELRDLFALAKQEPDRDQIRRQLWHFYTQCADTSIPEVHALAETVQAWWPEIEAFLKLNITNAATEGTNRLIKHIKRIACGFRNQQHFQDRVRLHCARSRQHRAPAKTRHLPAQD